MRKNQNKCIICNRDSYKKSIFCKYHYEAYINLKKAYETWKERLNISFEEYLILIQKNPYSGKWVKEVASYLRKVGENDIRENI